MRSRPSIRHALSCLAVVLGASPRSAQEAAAGDPPAQAEPSPQRTQAVPEAELALLFEGAFLGAENGQDFRETPGLRKILEQVSRFDPADLAARASATFEFADALADPRSYQGRFFRRRGIVVHVEAVRLRTPIFDQEDLYRAILADTDGERQNEAVVVDMLELPPELDLERDVVDVEGVFYRTVRYENRRGQMKEAPYMIVRRLVRVDTAREPKTSRLPLLGMILVGAALAYGLFRASMIWRRHRPRAPHEPMGGIHARAEQNRLRSMSQSSGTPPSPSCEKRD